MASTRAVTASAVIRPPAERTSLRTKAIRSPAEVSFGHSSSAAPGGREGLDQRLVALAAEVDDDQRQLGVGILRVADQRVGQGGGGLLDAADDDEPVPAEQRGRQDVGQLTDRQPGGGELVHLGVLVPGEDGGADGADRAGAQQLLLAHHHPQAGGGFHGSGRHACIVSRGSDTSRAPRTLDGPASRRPRAPRSPASRCRDRPLAATPQDAAEPTTARSPSRSVRRTCMPACASQVEQPAGRVAVGVVRAHRDQGQLARRWRPGTPGRRRRCRGAAPSARRPAGRCRRRPGSAPRPPRRGRPVNSTRTPRTVTRTTSERSLGSAAAVARSGAGCEHLDRGRADGAPVAGHEHRAARRRCAAPAGPGRRPRSSAGDSVPVATTPTSRPPRAPARPPTWSASRCESSTSGQRVDARGGRGSRSTAPTSGPASTSTPGARTRSAAAGRRPGRRRRRPPPRRRAASRAPSAAPASRARRARPARRAPASAAAGTARAPTPPPAAGPSAGRRPACPPASRSRRPAARPPARRPPPASAPAIPRARPARRPAAARARPTTAAARPEHGRRGNGRCGQQVRRQRDQADRPRQPGDDRRGHQRRPRRSRRRHRPAAASSPARAAGATSRGEQHDARGGGHGEGEPRVAGQPRIEEQQHAHRRRPAPARRRAGGRPPAPAGSPRPWRRRGRRSDSAAPGPRSRRAPVRPRPPARAGRRPAGAAATAPPASTIATFAPDTAVRCASPARRKSSLEDGIHARRCRRRRGPGAGRRVAAPGPARRRR